MAEDFRQQEKGTKKLNKIDMSIFNEKWGRTIPRIASDKLINVGKCADKTATKSKPTSTRQQRRLNCFEDHGYLKAEEVARERVEKEKEEAEKESGRRAPRQGSGKPNGTPRSSSLTSAAKKIRRRRRNAPKNVRRRTRKEERTQSREKRMLKR